MEEKKVLSVGLTGGIGSGKTLVSLIFVSLGIPVYYSDERARYLMNNDHALIEAIIEKFGTRAYLNGSINREFLASEIFNRKEKMEQLNQLVHPVVQQDFRLWVSKQQNNPYCIKEAALIFESGSYRDLDQTILVLAPENLRIRRIVLRDPHRTVSDIRKVIENQMNDEEKKKLATHIIRNDENRLVIPQVLGIHTRLMGRSG
jgi:dephospho-CoA kinase